MERTGFAGCCGGNIIYYIGGAEGYSHYRDFESFAKQIWQRVNNIVNIIITNPSQKQEREWLTLLGWSTEKTSQRLWVHTISYDKSSKIQNEMKDDINRKEKENKEKRLLEEKIRKEKFHEYVNGRGGKFSKVPYYSKGIFLDDVLRLYRESFKQGIFGNTFLRSRFNRNSWIEFRDILEKHYGIKLPDNFYRERTYSGWYYSERTFNSIVRSLNTRNNMNKKKIMESIRV